MHPVLLAKGKQLCVDLQRFKDVEPQVLANWRADYAKGIGDGKLFFATPGGMLVREKDQESSTSVRLDRTWIRKAELYTPVELRVLIDNENRTAFDILVAQLRSPVGVVPFVGAGLSVPFGYPGWPKFLREAAAFHRTPDKVLDLVKRNRLIEAASLLYEPSPDRFQQLVEKWFGAPVATEQVLTGPVSLLPLIAKGPSITTNFDRVLETAFEAAGLGFERPITALEPDNVIRAMHRNEHVLIKMHGDALDRSARVFTGTEYQQQYGKLGKRGIPTLARVMFTNRPLLFLGCSLDKDQTLNVLQELHAEIPGVTHYAVLAADYSIASLRRRRSGLEPYGISPLWFPPGDFARIGGILEELVHEASTRLLWRNAKPSAAWPKALRSPAKLGSRPRAATAASATPSKIDLLIRRLAIRLARGEVAFFLGAGIHLGGLPSARDFFSSLSRDYGFSEEDAQRAEVAQYLIDREGKSQTWAAARQKLLTRRTQPSAVCEFLAELPAVLRQLGRFTADDQWLLSTNYDTVLEEALAGRGERFHLLSYQVDGHNEGRFAHRDLSGSIRIIEQPENVRRLDSRASVIVKLDGGMSWDSNIPETVAISPLDFSVSSGRLLAALPEAVRQVLATRSLIVLGSSLRDAHVQRVVRWSAGTSRAVKTWAVMKPVTPTAAQYWPAAGVELVDCDLADFVGGLRRELESLSDVGPVDNRQASA
jgi:SIR2-like domain